MNILIIGVTEREQREKGIKNAVEEMMVENLPNLKEGNRFPHRKYRKLKDEIKGLTLRYDIIKMAIIKERILKAAREKQRVMEKVILIRFSVI